MATWNWSRVLKPDGPMKRSWQQHHKSSLLRHWSPSMTFRLGVGMIFYWHTGMQGWRARNLLKTKSNACTYLNMIHQNVHVVEMLGRNLIQMAQFMPISEPIHIPGLILIHQNIVELSNKKQFTGGAICWPCIKPHLVNNSESSLPALCLLPKTNAKFNVKAISRQDQERKPCDTRLNLNWYNIKTRKVCAYTSIDY